tara:strand:+ start:1108 stop:1227 length:120 start_codon:yes stop_codon:yes gene_type:complete
MKKLQPKKTFAIMLNGIKPEDVTVSDVVVIKKQRNARSV